jgi:hypothetical protein
VSAALLAFAITRDGFARWPLFISIAFMVNVELVQWSNLLAAAMLTPGARGYRGSRSRTLGSPWVHTPTA